MAIALYYFYLFLSIMVYSASAVSIMPELKQNVLRFGYGVNFRYEGMLLHLFDIFYVVTKVELPKVSDLNLTMSQFDYNCSHVTQIGRIKIGFNFRVTNTILNIFRTYCVNLIPYMYLYKHQVEYYEKMVYNILEKDIGMILPKIGSTESSTLS